jgi:hypothetical protein
MMSSIIDFVLMCGKVASYIQICNVKTDWSAYDIALCRCLSNLPSPQSAKDTILRKKFTVKI